MYISGTGPSGTPNARPSTARAFAHGIVAIGRPAITTDNVVYEELLHFLGSRGLGLRTGACGH
ncbi:hypothetical protein [Streptomyces sp. NBC_01462]|uniref:hypothetical protein n=1 Tax=Streptomyces sp. NBC_01462 TaxID=2903876 RepID=UPI002E378746|nr:hypothetical protein [Streptomyces sp. NBC_01462]